MLVYEAVKVSPLIPRFLLGTTSVTSSCSVEPEAEPRWGGDQLSAARRHSGCPADVQLGGKAGCTHVGGSTRGLCDRFLAP